MTQFPQRRLATRAPRVSLRETVSVVIQLENGKQLPAKLHKLSITGGLLETVTYLEERVRVGVTLPIGASFVRPKAEMLFPMWCAHGYLQPFRFTGLWAEERQILETEITELLKQSVVRSSAGVRSGLAPARFNRETF
jgi:hypothetical protein